MIIREQQRHRVEEGLRRSRSVLLTGPRQVGKTTLARTFVDPESPNYFDLERPEDLARLSEPMLALEPLEGTVVIDEVQLSPGLFPILRVLLDREPLPAKFLLLGSASPSALKQSSESLTGRIERIELPGFSIGEIDGDRVDELWLRGGFPGSFLAENDADSYSWRRQYVQSLVARELPGFGLRLPVTTIDRFVALVASRHAQIWQGAAPARALGIAQSSARHLLDTLADALIVRILPAWHTNRGKRLVKSPKVYIRDSGLLHTVLRIERMEELLGDGAVGPSFEGFAIEQLLEAVSDSTSPHFWATHNGAELDLMLPHPNGAIGFETKRSQQPTMTRSMHSALEDLELRELVVVHAGRHRFVLGDRVTAMPLAEAIEFAASEFRG